MMRGDVNCAKCGADLGYGWDAVRHERTLVGGYKAALCVDCVNVWGEHIRKSHKALWDSLKELDAEHHATQLCFNTAGEEKVSAAKKALMPLEKRRNEIEEQLYDIAKTWVADKVSAPTP